MTGSLKALRVVYEPQRGGQRGAFQAGTAHCRSRGRLCAGGAARGRGGEGGGRGVHGGRHAGLRGPCSKCRALPSEPSASHKTVHYSIPRAQSCLRQSEEGTGRRACEQKSEMRLMRSPSARKLRACRGCSGAEAAETHLLAVLGMGVQDGGATRVGLWEVSLPGS